MDGSGLYIQYTVDQNDNQSHKVSLLVHHQGFVQYKLRVRQKLANEGERGQFLGVECRAFNELIAGG